ncbi:ABC transporter permease [Candidatus Saccharibacteria bacterium]|nr:ABC transporter permease [Candidatus Saccharibacteria bacterium]MBQ6375604.1 ABC transporter permease [Candidatus Saccharibacteria bacterium]
MASLFRTHLRLARTSIRENRTRSFLTCLGIAIGVASIILILSLTGSISRLISSEVKDIGTNLIVVRPSTNKDSVSSVIEELTAANSFEKSNLRTSDVAAIDGISNVAAVAPLAVSYNTLTDEENTVESAMIVGTTPDFIDIEPLALKTGTFINDKNKENSVVIGHTLSLYLFNTTSPVGRTITFHGERFIVVGILDKIDQNVNFDNIDFDNALFMDISALAKVTDAPQIQQINVKTTTTDALPAVASEIKSTLISKHGGDTNFTVAYGDAITHPASNMLNIISGMLALVASISLVVGGIGVMNIMLVSVAERTHEIGIRKAVGASSSNILSQFMFEALLLSIMGGFLGIILGYLFAFIVSAITPFAPYISLQILAITFLTSIVVGIIFGTYPALKAAAKDPIESLKHYR